MAVRAIAVVPRDQGVLRAKAKRIRRVDSSVHRLVADMIDSMQAASGVGIAAPQIGVSLRVIAIAMPEEEPFAMINPEIVKASGVRPVTEGCLSVPGYRGEIMRSIKVVAKGMALNGKEIRIRAEDDLLAQALEHEINHVNGILYIDHLEASEQLHRIPDLPPEEEGGEAGGGP